MKKTLIAFMLCLVSSFAAFAATISGVVGDATYPVKGVAYTPNAVIFEDQLVIFYQLNDNKQQVAYSIAYANDDGSLVWKFQSYPNYHSYKTSTHLIRSEGISPVPALLNGKLYVFGRDGNKLIYNAVDTIGNLIGDQNWNSQFPHALYNANQARTLELDGNLNGVAAIEYPHTNLSNPSIEHRMLLTFYEKGSNGKFSYASCKPEAQSTVAVLYCEGAQVHHGKKYDGVPHLSNVYTYGDDINTHMYLRDSDGSLSTHYFAPSNHGWGPHMWYSSHIISKDAVKAGSLSVGTAEAVDEDSYTDFRTHLYFRQQGSNKLFKTTGIIGSSDWENATDTNIRMKDGRAVETIAYKGRAYVFYVDNENGYLKYFSDTDAVTPILPPNTP
jgi:hypothetical protein